MSVRVLLNLLNTCGKAVKCEALLSILSHFCNKFDKVNNTGAQMLSIYRDSKLLRKFVLFAMKKLRPCNIHVKLL